jgi:hypothetical protein
MWCDNPKCKKEVDINSVAVSKPRGALSMDIEGDVTPTMIHSTSNIINICKSCGESDYLFDSKASARKEDARQNAQRKIQRVQREKDAEAAGKVYKYGGIIALIASPIFGLFIGVEAIDGFKVAPFSMHTPIANFFMGCFYGTLVGFIISGLMVMVWPKDSMK